MVVKQFRPRTSQFERVEYSWPESKETSLVLLGETTTLVGWIPYHPEQTRVPEGFLLERYPNDSSIRMLLGSGNNAPPTRFKHGRNTLLSYLDLADFRGAIALDAPRLQIDVNRKPVKLEFDLIARVGATPYRGRELPVVPNAIVWQSDGVSESWVEIHHDEGRVWIRVFLRLKIGLVGQVIGRMATGYWPPWATMSIEYAFDVRGGVAEITFAGTAVPSQCRYVGWEIHSSHDIDSSLSEAGFDGFIQAGGCKDALATRTSVKSDLKEMKIGDEKQRG